MISHGEFEILFRIGTALFFYYELGWLGVVCACVLVYIDELEKNKA